MATTPPPTPEEQAVIDAYVRDNPSMAGQMAAKSNEELKAWLLLQSQANGVVDTGQAAILKKIQDLQNNTAPVDTTFSQQPYGVSGNRQASKATGQPIPNSYTGFQLPDPTQRKERIQPRYFQGDEDLLNTLSRTEVMTIQTGMKQAGILGKYRLGVVDDATSNAFKEVLGQANKIGGDWSIGLQVLQQAGPASANGVGGSGGLGVRVSNPDDLGKVIDNSAGLVLGRKVDPAMKQRLVQAYQMLERQQQAPNAGVYAEKQIGQKFGAEADAYKFAEFAQTILGGQGG